MSRCQEVLHYSSVLCFNYETSSKAGTAAPSFQLLPVQSDSADPLDLSPPTQHLPAIASTDSLRLLAVYSRSLASASDLSAAAASHASIQSPVDIYADDNDPAAKGNLDALLKREDVKTVILALPITLQPRIIERAWRAGKNVISEKPVAPDLAQARRLMQLYEKEFKPKGITW